MKKILIVEDDKQLVIIYSERFAREGYSVVTAMTGAEGLTLATNEKPDMVLLDVMLPGGMNGFDVLEELKRNTVLSHIPVLMLTNLDSEEKIARDIGVVDYLVKANSSLSDVVARVNQYIGHENNPDR